MQKQIFITLFLLATLLVPNSGKASTSTAPVLNFSDIISGPKTGNTDGAGGLSSSDHGAIVTIWGNNLGSTQGTSKVYFVDSAGTSREAAHIYYWKNADGQLPSGPADLYTYHKMQEIAFSIPASSADGAGQIKVTVNGIDSTTLPFEVRTGNIKYIKSGGDDSIGDGSWNNAWATINSTVAGGSKIAAGDLVYNVGVGENAGVSVGSNSAIAGTATDHISLIAYPNTQVTISGSAAGQTDPSTIYYANESPYWNWSKVSINTSVSGFALSRNNRIVGVEITGPTVYAGRSGAIGGNCNDVGGCTAPSGGEYLGIYIHDYGTDNNVPTAGHTGTTSTDYPAGLGTTWDAYQHLYSVSNRSGSPLDAYEIGWNYLANNPIFDGIRIYDRSSCGDWTGTMKIHHNVIQNQRGSAINVDFSNCTPSLLVPIEIHDNLIIQNPTVISYAGQSIKINTPTRAETPSINNRIYNNTFYGYIATNNFLAGNTDFENNITVDRMNLNYFDTAPSISSNNLFYSTYGLTAPAWMGNGSVNTDPGFTNANGNDFSLISSSSIISAGSNSTIYVATTDLLGMKRIAGSVSMGAIQHPLAAYMKFYITDFTTLVSNWFHKGSGNVSDLNANNFVNAKDLGIMMSRW